MDNMNRFNELSKEVKDAYRDVLKQMTTIESVLWKQYELIHGDESNDDYDAIHDDLLAHIQGFGEEIAELRAEMLEGLGTLEHAERWEKGIKEDYDFVNDLVHFYNGCMNKPEPPTFYIVNMSDREIMNAKRGNMTAEERYLKDLELENHRLEDSADYWQEQFVSLFNEVNEHGVLSDVLEKYIGENDNLNKLNKL